MNKKNRSVANGRKLARELDACLWRLRFRRDLLTRFIALKAPDDIIRRQKQLFIEALIEYSDARRAFTEFMSE